MGSALGDCGSDVAILISQCSPCTHTSCAPVCVHAGSARAEDTTETLRKTRVDSGPSGVSLEPLTADAFEVDTGRRASDIEESEDVM